MIARQEILENLKRQIQRNQHLIGVAAGAGITAKYAQMGGADFLLLLNSGRFRQMGRSSLAGYLPFYNSNEMVMEYSLREIKTLITRIPLIFGLNATDPSVDLEYYIEQIKSLGFEGINNYPTIGLIDGQFREALEEQGSCYQTEVRAIAIAHAKDLFTIAFVFNEQQALDMLRAGADIICAHLGFTMGGILGAKKVLSLEAAKERALNIFSVCDQIRPDVIKMIYGGPVKNPIDIQYMYNNLNVMGYIGGSSFERIPSEKSIVNITKAFKSSDHLGKDELMMKMLDGITKHFEYIEFVKRYVAENYMHDISFLDLAQISHISRSHLSRLFKKEVGCAFPEYLVKFRMKKATDIMKENLNISLRDVSELVGYRDYSQFSKMFKKYIGIKPSDFQRRHKHN